MTKKVKTYGLLVVVLSIWGIIGYRIITTLSPHEAVKKENTAQVIFNPNKTTSIDTFSISPIKRDPFLGKLYVKPIVKSSPKRKKVKEEIQWPMITYQGLVKKMQPNSQQVFVITLNNRQYLAKKGQKIQEVTLLKGSEESIEVSYQNQHKKIERK